MKKKKDKDEFVALYGPPPKSIRKKYKAKDQNEYEAYGPPRYMNEFFEEDDLDTIEDEG